MTRDVLCIASVVSLAALTTFAAGPPQTATPQAALSPQAPVFRGSVDYVPVDVVVTDSHDHPITDLTAADFQILDSGQPQHLTDFRFVNVPLAHRATPTAATGAAPTPPPADVETNAPATPNSRLFVLIIDDKHLLEPLIIPVQRVMTEFIDNLSPDDQAAVLFVGRSDLSQNFTNDHARLLKAVSSVRAAFGFGIGVFSDEQVEELPYARDVAWELQNVAKVLADSNYARRAVVFVGAFSQLDPAATLDSKEHSDYEILRLYMNDVFAAAKRADVPIYTLDPRGIPNDGNAITPRNPHVFQKTGLIRDPTTGIQKVAPDPDRDAPRFAQPPVHVDTHRAAVQQDHLAEIAINTGGRAFINRSDLTGAMDEILTENGSFYELGYYPSPTIHDGKFHDIKVVVTRPGAHVRARTGYVAASAAPPTPKSLADSLNDAMGGGLNVSGIAMRAFAAPLAASANGMRAGVTLEVTYPALPDGQRQLDDDLRISVMALDPDGKIRSSAVRPWHVSAQIPTETSVTFLVNDLLDLKPGIQTLRIGAASRVLGKTGSIQVELDVPQPTKGALQLSGLALGLAGAPREPVVGANLLTAVVPFQPTPSRAFGAADTLRVFTRVFLSSKLTASATVRLADDAGAVKLEQPVPVAVAPSGNRPEGAIDATVPLRGVPSGDYVLTVDVRTSNGDTASRAIPLTIR